MSRKPLPEPWERKSILSAMSRLELKMAGQRLKSYPHWLEQIRELDEWFESQVFPDFFGGCFVKGGVSPAIQERILILKESHPGYKWLLDRVNKIEAIFGVLEPCLREVVRLWHFEKTDEYDICGILEISRGTLFSRKKQAEKITAYCWDLGIEGIKSGKVSKKIILEV